MKGVLVDTSVWVDHFRYRNDALVELLELDLVMMHPPVVGELACGTPPNRVQVLADLNQLQQTQQASLRGVMRSSSASVCTAWVAAWWTCSCWPPP